MIDITPIINLVIAVVAAIISGYLIPFIKKKCDLEKFKEVIQWVEILVDAAEQVYGPGCGKEKKRYVVERLKSMGYDINEAQINDLIESSVLKFNQELFYEPADDVEDDDYDSY